MDKSAILQELLPFLIKSAIIYGPGYVRDIIDLFKKDNITVEDLDAVFHEGLKNSYDDYINGTNTPIVLPKGTTPAGGGQ